MSSDPKQAEYGDRMLCDPWRGARTPEFRKFKRDLKASADAMFLTVIVVNACVCCSSRLRIP